MADITQDYQNLLPADLPPPSQEIILDPSKLPPPNDAGAPITSPADAVQPLIPGQGMLQDESIDTIGSKIAGDAYPAIKAQVQQGVSTPQAIDNVAVGAKELAEQAGGMAEQQKEALQQVHTEATVARDKYSAIYDKAKEAANAYQAAQDAQQAAQAERQQKDEEALQKAQDEMAESKQNGAKSLYEIMHSSSLGSKIGAGIAVMMGGLAQGLTRSNSNQVFDSIERAAAAEGEKRKFTQSQIDNLKSAVRQRTIDGLQMKEKTLTNQTELAKLQDMISQARLRDQQAELDKVKALAAGNKAGRDAEQFNGKPLTINEVAALTPEERKGLVQIKGSWYRSAVPEKAKEFSDLYERYENIRPALANMRKLLENGQFESFVKKGLTGGVEDKRKFEQQKEMIMETIKAPYMGKGGIFRKDQREQLSKILAKRDLTSLTSVEKDVLKDFVVDFDYRVKNAANAAGFNNIDVINRQYVPVTQNGKTSYVDYDKFIAGLKANPKFAGVSQKRLEDIVDKKIQNYKPAEE